MDHANLDLTNSTFTNTFLNRTEQNPELNNFIILDF